MFWASSIAWMNAAIARVASASIVPPCSVLVILVPACKPNESILFHYLGTKYCENSFGPSQPPHVDSQSLIKGGRSMFNSPVSARSRTSPYLPRNALAPRAKSASPLLLAGLFATALCVGPAFADNEDHKAGAVRLLGSIPIPSAALMVSISVGSTPTPSATTSPIVPTRQSTSSTPRKAPS